MSTQEDGARPTVAQRVLITGGAGFIGSHLAEALLKRGCRVTVLDNLSSGRRENISHLLGHKRFRLVIETVMNEVVLDHLASESDAVFHLAAAVGVQFVVDHPVQTIEANVMGTYAVLAAAQRYGAKVLLASTSEIYGKGQEYPFREDADVHLGSTSRSRWAYAASKMIDEFLALAYHRERGLPVVVFRLFNTVGPRQSGRYGMVVPRFVEQALKGQPLTVYGDGQQSRCFLHVRDAVRALIELAECPAAVGGVFNVGATEEVTIKHLAERVLTLVDGRSASIVGFGSQRERIAYIPYEEAYAPGFEDMQRRLPDVSRIKGITGWQAELGLDDILRDVISERTTSRTITAP